MILSKTLTGLLALTLASAVCSQSSYHNRLRDRDLTLTLGFDPGDPDVLRIPPHLGGVAPVLKWNDSSGAVTHASFNLPFDHFGGAWELFPTRPAGERGARYLVTGLGIDSANQPSTIALICDFVEDAQGAKSFQVLEVEVWPGMDVTQVALLEGSDTLYLFDYDQRRILASDVSGRAVPDLLPDYTAFQVVADATSSPNLQSPMSAHLANFIWRRGTPDSLVFQGASTQIEEVYQLGAATQVGPIQHMVTTSDPLHVHDGVFDFHVSLADPTSLTWSLKDWDGNALGVTGGFDAAGAAQATADFWRVAGNVALLSISRGASELVEVSVKGQGRVGAPYSGLAGFTVGGSVCDNLLEVGTTDNISGVCIDSPNLGTIQAYKLMAYANANGKAPTGSVLGQTVLLADASLGMDLDSSRLTNAFGIGCNVPDDARAIGEKIYQQYVFLLPGGAVALSDIVGFEICPVPGSDLDGPPGQLGADEKIGMLQNSFAYSGPALESIVGLAFLNHLEDQGW